MQPLPPRLEKSGATNCSRHRMLFSKSILSIYVIKRHRDYLRLPEPKVSRIKCTLAKHGVHVGLSARGLDLRLVSKLNSCCVLHTPGSPGNILKRLYQRHLEHSPCTVTQSL